MKKNNYCTFYIIRHGETEWNTKRIIQGQKDSPLTENGIKQAEESAKIFKNIQFDAIYSSDLLRAKRTAEIIALEKKMAVSTSKLLRERLLGRFQGIKYTKFKKELKEQFEKRNQLAKQERFNFKLTKGIETDHQVVSRLITFLRESAVVHSGKKVLVVSHGGTIRVLLIHLGWADYQELPSGSVKNTGYIILDSDGTDFFVKKVVGCSPKQPRPRDIK